MTQSPPDDFGAIAGSRSAAELRKTLANALRRLGFSPFEYLWFTYGADAVVLYSLGSPSAAARRRLWLDPLVQHCRVAYTPVVWQALAPDTSVRQVLTWAPWKGLPIHARTGVALPVHGPDGGFALLNASVSAERTSVVPPESVHGAHARALAVYETVLERRDDSGFGLTRDVVETADTASVPFESVENSRVQPAAKH